MSNHFTQFLLCFRSIFLKEFCPSNIEARRPQRVPRRSFNIVVSNRERQLSRQDLDFLSQYHQLLSRDHQLLSLDGNHQSYEQLTLEIDRGFSDQICGLFVRHKHEESTRVNGFE
jgi:hypothetical protein